MKTHNFDGPARPRRGFQPAMGLVLALIFLAGCNQEDLVRVDTEKEANRILVELADNNIPDAQVETSSDRKSSCLITVPYKELNRAREVLLRLNLPRGQNGGFDELVNQTSLIPSAEDERAKLIRATTGELEKTFETYDGVVEARVHVVMPEKDSMQLGTTRPSPSAMVLIKFNPKERAEVERMMSNPATNPDANQPTVDDTLPTIAAVQHMVARSVEGLTESGVEVHFTAAGILKLKDSPNRFFPDGNQDIFAILGAGIGIVLTLMGIGIWRLVRRPKSAARDLASGSSNAV